MVLQSEHIVTFPGDGVSRYLRMCPGVDETPGDADACAFLLHTAFKYQVCAELATRLLGGLHAVSEQIARGDQLQASIIESLHQLRIYGLGQSEAQSVSWSIISD